MFKKIKEKIKKKIEAGKQKPEEGIQETITGGQKEEEIKPAPVTDTAGPDPIEIKTTDMEVQDRQLRYAKNPPCPKCKAHLCICTIRRGNYSAFRCRACGHRFEVNR